MIIGIALNPELCFEKPNQAVCSKSAYTLKKQGLWDKAEQAAEQDLSPQGEPVYYLLHLLEVAIISN